MNLEEKIQANKGVEGKHGTVYFHPLRLELEDPEKFPGIQIRLSKRTIKQAAIVVAVILAFFSCRSTVRAESLHGAACHDLSRKREGKTGDLGRQGKERL